MKDVSKNSLLNMKYHSVFLNAFYESNKSRFKENVIYNDLLGLRKLQESNFILTSYFVSFYLNFLINSKKLFCGS